jgi:hypothetical protein
MMNIAGIIMLTLVFYSMVRLAIKLYRNGQKKLRGIENGYYKTFNATIVDVHRRIKSVKTDNGLRRRTSYFIVVEYIDNGIVKLAEVPQHATPDDVGASIKIYVNEAENDIQTDKSLPSTMYLSYIVTGITLFLAGLVAMSFVTSFLT